MRDKTVMIYLEKDGSYLMIYRNKKKNDINEGKYLGIGGHIEEGESKEEALVREVKEETGLTLKSFSYIGLVHFQENEYKEDMFIFHSSDFVGKLIECNEGELHFIKKKDILSLPLWEGDHYFLELMNQGVRDFELSLIYQNGKIIKYERIK